MIKSIAIALAALLVSGQAFAQNTTTTSPDGIGGWDTRTTAPNGHITGQSTTMPDGIGGSITTPSVHR